MAGAVGNGIIHGALPRQDDGPPTARCTGLHPRRRYPGRDLAHQERERQHTIVRENDVCRNRRRDEG